MNKKGIHKALIQAYGMGQTEPEFKEVKAVLEKNGITGEWFTKKHLSRRQLDLSENVIVIGNHEVMRMAFKQLDVRPPTDSYPEMLHPFLKRSIRTTTLRKLLDEDVLSFTGSIFVKPKFDTKAFTGFLINNLVDKHVLYSYKKDMEVYVVNPVEWKSEFRVYIQNTKIVGMGHYAGDQNLKPDMRVVDQAVDILTGTEFGVAGYALDFGVLKNNETALIEWNDGYALGNYGVAPEVYTELLLARWVELRL